MFKALRRFSKSIGILVVNVLVYILLDYFYRAESTWQPIPGSTPFPYEWLPRPIYIQLLLLVLGVIHILIVLTLTSSVVFAALNRLCFYFQIIILGYDNLSINSLIREFVSLLITLIIARLLITVKVLSVYPSSREFREAARVLSIRKLCMRDLLKATPILLASHSIAYSIFTLLLTMLLTTRGVTLENLAKSGILNLYIQLSLLILALLYAPNRELCEIALLGVFSATGLLGLSPLLMILPRKISYITQISRVFYKEPVGVFIGIAEAELAYGEPRNIYSGVSQEYLLGTSSRETWFFREVLQPIYVKLEDLNTPHIVIVGASGTGKTTLVKHLVLEFNRTYGYRFLIIDPHGEYSTLTNNTPCRVIDASKYTINPLVLENTSPRDRALQLSHVIASIFKLGFIQRKMLEEVILRTYASRGITENPDTWRLKPPTLGDMVSVCKELSELNQEYLRILPYLSLISENIGFGTYLSIEDLLRENTIIDLSRVSSDFAKAIFVETLMYMLISKMYSAGKIRLQLVIDEVRHIMPRALGMELLSRIFMESRKFGFSTIVVSQDVKRIPKTLLNNAGLRVFFTLNEPESIKIATDIMGGAVKAKSLCISEVLKSLKQYTYIVHATGSENIFIMKLSLTKP